MLNGVVPCGCAAYGHFTEYATIDGQQDQLEGGQMSDNDRKGWPEPESTDAATVPQVAPTTPDGSGPGTDLELSFAGTRRDFRKLLFRQMLLMIPTFGVYWFWARTNVRRFIWGHLSIGGSRLEYSGRGMELFLGFLIVGVAMALAFWAIQFLILTVAGPQFAPFAWFLTLYPLLGILGVIAIYRRHRYMIRRTSWRGIHCGLSGSTGGFVGRIVLPLLATVFTLGLAYPWLVVTIQRYLVSNMSLGSERFTYQGRVGDIFGRWIICWLLMPFTGGLALAWWRGYTTRFMLRQTRLASLGFSSGIRPMRFVSIYFIGGLIAGLIVYGLFFTVFGVLFASNLSLSTGLQDGEAAFDLGNALLLVIPFLFMMTVMGPVTYATFLYFVEYQTVEYVFETTEIVGTMDLDSIVQVRDADSGAGSGLDAVLGMDGI